MADLGPNTYPHWQRGSVPSVEEWQRLFSLKLDNNRVVEELSSALQKATPEQAAILLSVLVPAVTGKITESGEIVTADGLRQALAGYQPKGNYQPAGDYQPAGVYVTGTGHSAGDRNPTNLWGNSQGGVSVNFSDGSAVALATVKAVTDEAARAKQAEAGLLPLTGGQVTGPISRAGGGVLPEVLGLGTGRVVTQYFRIQNLSNSQYVPFPVAFNSPDPVNQIFITYGYGYNSNGGNPESSILYLYKRKTTNQGFWFDRSLSGFADAAFDMCATGVM